MSSISDPSHASALANTSTAMPAPPTLRPTWHGYVADTRDALILFENAIPGILHRVVRRPHDRERSNLIKSGSVFVYEESASGIKRWTDGVPWSPSRILNNFLIYRELEKPFPPGEKKRATKKAKRDSRPGDPYARAASGDDLRVSASPPSGAPPISSPHSITSTTAQNDMNADRDAERQLVGSLTDSYQFKAGGLVKKTMSVKVDGVSYHLVSYYTPEDVMAGLLPRPIETQDLRDTVIREELLRRQAFRAPLEDQQEESPQASYRAVPAQSPYSQMNYVASHTSHPYLPPASMNPPSSYYGSHMPQYQMPPHPIQHQGFGPAPTTEHYSSYSGQREPPYNPRGLYNPLPPNNGDGGHHM